MPSKLKQVVTHTFEGAMQRDTALWVIEKNNYYHGLNIRIFQSGQQYIITNPLGSTEIPFNLPAGVNYCLGSYADAENNKFYWFNHNSAGYHGVYLYNYTLNNVIPILINLTDTAGVDLLQFKKRSLILMIDVIKATNGNDLIYWCDGQVKQKKFNIQKALDKSDAGYGMIVTAADINAYKLAAGAPITGYFTDTSRETNFVYGHLYKASLRQWFDDGEKNNWSEFSTVALPVSQGFTGNPAISNINNTLQITIETGPSIVKQLEIALKDGINNFVSIVVLDKAKLAISDNSTYVYSFYNDNTSYSGLEQDKVYRAYSFMPRLAALQAFCQNAMVYGKGVEGFPIVDVLISSAVIYSDLFVASGVANTLNVPVFTATLLDHDYTKEGHGRRRNSLISVVVGNDVKAGNKFDLYGRNGQWDNLYFTYTATNADSAITVADNFKQQLIATGRILGASQNLPNTDIWTNSIDGLGNVTFNFIWRGRFAENLTSFTGQVNPVSFQTLKDNGQSVLTQKSGDSVNYGVLYWNEDTYRSNVYTSNGGFVRNDFVTQSGGFKKIEHQLTISNQPPDWATHWELVRTTGLTYGSLASDYIQILIQKAIKSQSTTDTDYVDLVIGSLYTYQKMYPNTIVRYDFQKNDRVRLMRKENSGTYYPFTETVILDFKEVGTSLDVNEDVTTNNTATVTIGGATSVDNIGRYIVIDNVERQIIAAPSGTTYTLDRTFGTAVKYTSFQIVDKRGIIRVRKPVNIIIEDNSLIEVYKPTQNVETAQKNFHLFGQKYAIINPGTATRAHSGNVQNQSGATPAIVSVSQGTSYVRNRQLPTNNAIPGTQAIVGLIEDNSYSDFFESALHDNGKVAPEDDGSGEIRFGSRLRYSNNYIEGTRINGLNDFDNLDREDYNDPWGDAMLLKYRDRLLYMFKQLRVGYIGVLNSIITTSDGEPSLAATTKFLNQFQSFSWEGGIGNNPESYASDQTWQYFLSPNSGTDCRIGGDGILPISHQFGLSQTVGDYIDLAQKYGSFVFGGIDRQSGERILAFEPYKPFVYRGPFTEAYWKLYNTDLPGGTVYEITTQPVNGTDSVPVAGVTTYTPNLNFLGSDPSFFRWSIGAAWSAAKKICMTVDDVPIPPPAPIYYNAILTVAFIKNNCDPGYHGSSVNYIVPALKYSSPYSQADADQQAADDATINGQIYANNNGACLINDPAAFAFIDQNGLEINTLTESNAVVPSAAYANYVISITGTGAQYQINGGAWTNIDGIVNALDSVKIRRTTSGSYLTAATATLTIGAVSDTWDITTKVAPAVTVNYALTKGRNPYVDILFVPLVNGVNIGNIYPTSTGTFAGIVAGNTVYIGLEHAITVNPWPASSKASVVITADGVSIFNSGDIINGAIQSLASYSFIALEGVVYQVTGVSSSTSILYVSPNPIFSMYNYSSAPLSVSTEVISFRFIDSTDGLFKLFTGQNINPQLNIDFNWLIDANTGSLTVVNTSAYNIDFTLSNGGAYNSTVSILAGGTGVFTAIPKTSYVVSYVNAAVVAPISCGVPTAYSGGVSFPTTKVVTLGAGLGTVTLNFDGQSIPDKFIVVFDGVQVINTGYRGSTAEQANLNAALASYGLPPETITAPGNGTATFTKSTATTTATVYVYAPMSGTAWSFTLSCPV